MRGNKKNGEGTHQDLNALCCTVRMGTDWPAAQLANGRPRRVARMLGRQGLENTKLKRASHKNLNPGRGGTSRNAQGAARIK